VLTLLAVSMLFGSCTSGPPETTVEPEPSTLSDEERDRVPEDGAQALEWLLEGNRRFVEGRPRHDFESQRRRMMLTEGQHPFGVVLGCADSRVPPELIFDFGLGDLFVIRVAGNVVADDEAGSIEYAIAHLDVPLVLVLGHEGCGAVTAALGKHDAEPTELVELLQLIHPAVADIDPSLPEADRVHLGVEANVRQSVARLLEIAEREARPDEQRVMIVGAVYELDTGHVRVLDD
jgi:carbonic anhydrase